MIPIQICRLVLTFATIHIATDIDTSRHCLTLNFKNAQSLKFYIHHV